MSLRKSCAPSCVVLLAVCILILSASCGGGSSSSSRPLSAAQVQAITTEMQAGFSTAMQSMNGTACPGGGPANQFCFQTTVYCPAGGTIAVDGQFTMNLDANNTGQVIPTMTLTPSNCAVRTSNLVVNGDPNLKFTATMNVLNTQVTDFTATQIGGISYGPDPQGNCDSNLTITATVTPTQTCRVRGTACGQPVDYSCQ